MDIYIRGKKIVVSPKDALGKGGEADIYKLDPRTVAKIFKAPNHQDYSNQPFAQQAAKERIQEHQQKLPAFLALRLPSCVVGGIDLVTNRNGVAMGYTMPLIDRAEVMWQYGQRKFRETSGISNNQITGLGKKLYAGIGESHTSGVILGDALNDLNVMARGDDIFIIDADSTQFGPYLCKTFTPVFVDPLLCDPGQSRLMLISPHNQDSDWYAYNVMLFKTWLYVAPYEGTLKGQQPISEEVRPLHRVTVFNADVRYPKKAIPYTALNDDLLHHFQAVFIKDLRGVFPYKLIENLEWKECTSCGMVHCRVVCPACKTMVPQKRVTVQAHGKVTCEKMFETKGVILYTTYEQNSLRWLYHEDGKFKRESGRTFIEGKLEPFMRFRTSGDRTFIGKGNRVTDGKSVKMADQFGNLTVFDANSKCLYWSENGRLMRETPTSVAPTHIGDVLSGQSLFWVGEDFGFGFYRAGEVDVAFVFNADRVGINHFVKLPFKIRGQLVDSTCLFSHGICWFGVAYQDQGITHTAWAILNLKGEVLASTEATWQDGSWAGTIRGKSPAGKYLFIATDDGLARVTFDQGGIFMDKTFPDSEPFVDGGNSIQVGGGGIYVISAHEINLIKIN
jgi:hypothetical protein